MHSQRRNLARTTTEFKRLTFSSFSLLQLSTMATEIKNTRVIVTGGAQGIGRGICKQLLLTGAKALAILDKDATRGTETIKALNHEFGQGCVYFFATDVSIPSQFENSFQAAITELGGLDIVINNAGFLNDVEWSLEVDVNVKGVIQGTLMALETMGKHKGGKGGTVINISSIAGVAAFKYTPIYCATKFAVLGFSQAVSQSFDRTGVAVKVMCPGPVNTALMNNTDRRFASYLDYNEAYDFMTQWPLDKIETMAKDILRLIKEAPNGDVWLSEIGIPISRLNIPNYLSYATPI